MAIWKLPPGVVNRLADNWRPLFAIADLVGGGWPQRLAGEFGRLNELTDEDGQGIGVALLADIRDVFADSGEERIGSYDLSMKLAGLEGRPWAEHGRRKEVISQNEIARILKPFGIQTRNAKFDDGHVRKAYHSEDFQDAFARYLPS